MNSEAIFLQIKRRVQEIATTEAADGSMLSAGQHGDEYSECPEVHKQLCEWIIAFYWAHSKDPMTGFKVYTNKSAFDIFADCTVCWWQPTNAKVVAVRPDGGEYSEASRYLMPLKPGKYRLRELASGIIFAHATLAQCAEYGAALELEGFPIPASLRVTGFNRTFTGLGVERGRLPNLYRTGKDTAAVMLLLLHGASRLSLNGFGPHVLPMWVDEEHREVLVADLLKLTQEATDRCILTEAQVGRYAPRFNIPLLGGILSGRQPIARMQTPTPDHSFEWSDVSFRLTLGWKELEEDGPTVAVAADVVIELFEVGGVSLAGSKNSIVPTVHSYALSLFFGDAELSDDPAVLQDARTDMDFVNVAGSDLRASFGSGSGSKFSETDLAELSRRSGISTSSLREAWGEIAKYKLTGGLLQRQVYARSTGTHEFLTVIPEGDWRTVEHGVQRRRLSLRRYIVMIFHCTALGPHRDRDRTVSAILDAGCWWQGMFTDVSGFVRTCLVCSSAKARPVVTGHQRSRDYDGPFRFLVIDFVGPMNPTSGQNFRYMFTCACAWSGWYWAVPCERCDSETAATCLFYRVICDIAGYPAMIGSDRDRAFTEGVIKHLINFFGIHHVIGTAYHPQSQSAVERPHREYNSMCRTFMANFQDWDTLACIFAWTIRTTCKLFNGHYTPYEVITGMKPRSPIEPLLAQPVGLSRITTDDYVRELVNYLKGVHKFVDERHKAIRENEQRAKYRELGTTGGLACGDYCLVSKTKEPGISHRFQNPNFEAVFQVVEVHGEGDDAKAYTVSDLHGNREGLGFGQPLALTRLTPIELLPLAELSEDQATGILLSDRGRDRPATVKAQCMDGKVYVVFDDDPHHEHLLDLATCKYQWLP